MLGQLIMSISCILPLTAFANKKNILGSILVFMFAVTPLICNIYIYDLYVISVFSMYVFSMPLAEANTLAGFNRYMLTIDVFILGVAVSFVLKDSMDDLKAFLAVLLVMCMVCTVFQYKSRMRMLIKKQDYRSSTRYQFQQLLREYEVPLGSKYLLYNATVDYGYMHFLSRYELWSSAVTVANMENFDDRLQDVNAYQYIIVVTPDEASQLSLRNAGLEKYAVGSEVVINTDTIAAE